MSRLYHGPRDAYFGIRLESGCSASYSSRDQLLADSAYYTAHGQAHVWTVTERCVYPGCDGGGRVSVKTRRGWRDAECPQCAKVGRPADVTHVLPIGVTW